MRCYFKELVHQPVFALLLQYGIILHSLENASANVLACFKYFKSKFHTHKEKESIYSDHRKFEPKA